MAETVAESAQVNVPGYSQVIPSQPTAKNELKTKRKTAAAIPEALLTWDVVAASTTIESCKGYGVSVECPKLNNRKVVLTDCPIAPNIINFRRPNFSIVKMAIQLATKYSVPLSAASSLLVKLPRPMLFWKMVAA